jgi:hypothetical protein
MGTCIRVTSAKHTSITLDWHTDEHTSGRRCDQESASQLQWYAPKVLWAAGHTLHVFKVDRKQEEAYMSGPVMPCPELTIL